MFRIWRQFHPQNHKISYCIISITNFLKSRCCVWHFRFSPLHYRFFFLTFMTLLFTIIEIHFPFKQSVTCRRFFCFMVQQTCFLHSTWQSWKYEIFIFFYVCFVETCWRFFYEGEIDREGFLFNWNLLEFFNWQKQSLWRMTQFWIEVMLGLTLSIFPWTIRCLLKPYAAAKCRPKITQFTKNWFHTHKSISSLPPGVSFNKTPH